MAKNARVASEPTIQEWASRLPAKSRHLGWRLACDEDPQAFYRGDTYQSESMSDAPSDPYRAAAGLSEVIRSRIRQRLGDRVHELCVAVEDGEVVLSGRCATFYTKQLAQHAALGVLNDEQLENRIEVTIG